jgi:hypothetical protein
VLNATGEAAQHRLETLTLSILYLYQLKSYLLWSNPLGSIMANSGLRFGIDSNT